MCLRRPRDCAAVPMDGFDLMLLIVVSYLAVTALVRMMLARRDRLIKRWHQQLEGQLRERSST